MSDKYLLVGDIHGCFDEFRELLDVSKFDKEKRTVISVGDLCDRGPNSPAVLDWFIQGKMHGYADACLGNHDNKLMRWAKGNKVKPSHGLQMTIDQLEGEEFEGRHFFDLPKTLIYYFLKSLKLVYETENFIAVHAAYAPGNTGYAQNLALYGETTGEKDATGFPVRLDTWKKTYIGTKDIIHGHIVVENAPEVYKAQHAEIMDIDGGCCFGGTLVGITYPEKKVFQVKAKKVYFDKH